MTSLRLGLPFLVLVSASSWACGSSRLEADGANTGGTASGGSSATGASAGGDSSKGDGGCPDGAFVSLTYDDSLSSQLTNAVPALKNHGFHATFFLTQTTSAFGALLEDGHELAAHTTVHPCPKADWVTPGNASEDYTLDRMATELDQNSAAVIALGQKAPLAFAYPCGVSWVGADHESYVPLVKERYSGARGVVGSVIQTLTDPYDVPAYFLMTGAPGLIAVADDAVTKKGWVVFGFHGIGGDYNTVTTEAHEALLAHLDEQKTPVLTFSEGLACKKAK